MVDVGLEAGKVVVPLVATGHRAERIVGQLRHRDPDLADHVAGGEGEPRRVRRGAGTTLGAYDGEGGGRGIGRNPHDLKDRGGGRLLQIDHIALLEADAVAGLDGQGGGAGIDASRADRGTAWVHTLDAPAHLALIVGLALGDRVEELGVPAIRGIHILAEIEDFLLRETGATGGIGGRIVGCLSGANGRNGHWSCPLALPVSERGGVILRVASPAVGGSRLVGGRASTRRADAADAVGARLLHLRNLLTRLLLLGPLLLLASGVASRQ